MSLYDLRKKYQLLFSALPDEIDLLMRKKIIEILDEEIAEIESRVSQLEKEPAFCENCSLKCIASDCVCDCHSRYRAARVSINELRGVLGFIEPKTL